MTALWLLTGPRGAGKTTFCRHFADHARRAGWDVSGLLSPAVFENGVKTGIQAASLRTGETCPLASTVPTPGFDLQLGRWYFDLSAIEWGNRVLETCLPSDLLLVDELGPLELLRGEGWAMAIPILRQPRYRLGLVVIRPELVETARSILPLAGTIHVHSSNNPEATARRWWETLSKDGYGR